MPDIVGRRTLSCTMAVVCLAGCTPLADADERGAQPGADESATGSAAERARDPFPGSPPASQNPVATRPAPENPTPAAAPGVPLDPDPAMVAPAPPVANVPVVDAAAPPPALDACPGGETLGESCYRVSLAPLPWNEARADCLASGADLVVVGSAEEDVFVASLVDVNVWLGASDQLSENLFQWVDGSMVLFGNWGPGQPDAFPGPDCVEKRQDAGELWFDQPCGNARVYVCESTLAP